MSDSRYLEASPITRSKNLLLYESDSSFENSNPLPGAVNSKIKPIGLYNSFLR